MFDFWSVGEGVVSVLLTGRHELMYPCIIKQNMLPCCGSLSPPSLSLSLSLWMSLCIHNHNPSSYLKNFGLFRINEAPRESPCSEFRIWSCLGWISGYLYPFNCSSHLPFLGSYQNHGYEISYSFFCLDVFVFSFWIDYIH